MSSFEKNNSFVEEETGVTDKGSDNSEIMGFTFVTSTGDAYAKNQGLLWALDVCKHNKTNDIAYVNALIKYYEETFSQDDPLVNKVVIELLNQLIANDQAGTIQLHFDLLEQEESSRKQVQVLPFMCGTGKSCAISLQILRTLVRPDSAGLLVITDRKDRLDDYVHPTKYYPAVSEYLDAHKDEYCLITGETMAEEISRQNRCRVLLTTTQHFHNLPLRAISELKFWGKEKHPRSLVLFDEEPMIAEFKDILLSDLDDVNSAFKYGFPRTPEMSEKKEFCVSFWKKIEQDIRDFIEPLEKQNQGKAYYVLMNLESPDPKEEQRFHTIIRTVKKDLDDFRGRNEPIVSRIEQVLHFYHEPVLVCLRDDSNKLHTSMCRLQDNSENFKALMSEKTMVIILDGTAEVCPNYDLHPELFARPRSAFYKHSLQGLTIHTYHKYSGLSSFRKLHPLEKRNFCLSVKEAVEEYGESSKVALFCRLGMEGYFKRCFTPGLVGHFNALAGKNFYKKCSRIAQVGLNHQRAEKYILYSMAIDPEFRDELINASLDKQHEMINACKQKDSKTWDIMCRFICSDIEQNLFRGTIRTYPTLQVFELIHNKKKAGKVDVNEYSEEISEELRHLIGDYHFFLFFNLHQYQRVVELLQKRFEPLGGRIECNEKSSLVFMFQEHVKHIEEGRLTYKDTNLAKLIRGLEKLDPAKEYKRSDIAAVAGLTGTQFNKIQQSEMGKKLLTYINVKHGIYQTKTLLQEPGIDILFDRSRQD